MTKEYIMARLSEIFKYVFEDAELIIDRNTTENNIALWDSLTHIQLINAVESIFEIRFSFEEVMKIITVGNLVDCIFDKTNKY
jgi:acyl carrier protein